MNQQHILGTLRKHSIRTRMGISLLTIITGILTAFGVYQYVEIKSRSIRELHDFAENTTNKLAETLKLPLFNIDHNVIRKMLLAELMDKRLYAAVVSDYTGEHMFKGKKDDEQWEVTDTWDNITGDVIHQRKDIVLDDAKIGEIEIYVTKKFMVAALQHEIVNTIVTIIVIDVATLVLLGGALLQITRPLATIVTTANAIAAGDFHQEINIKQHDEIGDLAQAFRYMQATISSVSQEITSLVHAVKGGNLEARGKIERFAGDWKELVIGTNNLIDAFVTPFHVTTEYIDLVSKGGIPDKIREEYHGDFNELKQNLNLLIESMQETTRIADEIAAGNLRIAVNTRSEHDRLMQAFQRMAAYLGDMASLSTAIAAGDFQQNIRPKSEYDVLGNAFRTMARQLQENFARIEAQLQEIQCASAERERLVVELREKNIELTRLDKLKDEFLANTSHELRTPLNGIAGLADALLGEIDGPITDQQRRHLQMIRQSSVRLTNLVNAILDFSKIRARKVDLYLQPFALSEVTEIVLAFANELVKEKPVGVELELPADLPFVYGDLDRVQQILMNLVGNAVKFTNEGAVTITAQRDGEFVRISVRDTGIGMTPEALTRIFNPFEQADGSTTREFGGTGLGLSISKCLVEQQDGRIWVESELGKGSVFHFTLPCREGLHDQRVVEDDTLNPQTEADEPAAIPEDDDKSLIPGVPQVEQGTILIVDDDPTNVEVLRAHLEHAGLTIIDAPDGQAAYQQLTQQSVDLILCDVMMPLLDGYTLAASLQNHPTFCRIPLIFVSAKDRRQDKLSGYHAGAVDYLTKPVEREELLGKIHALLQFKRHYEAEHEGMVTTQDSVYALEQEREETYSLIRDGQGKKILVVDDEPVNLEVLKTHLTQYQYTVVTASNGVEGLEQIEREQPDLVLLDLMMPKMSGFKMCRIIREEKRLKELPVIMLTAKDGLQEKISGLRIGADDYITKPFNIEELLARVYVFLRIRDLQKQLLEERNLLRTLIDTIPDSIYAKDEKGRMLVANTKVIRAVGATTINDLSGKTVFDIFPLEKARRYWAEEQEVLKQGHALINREYPYTDHELKTRRWMLTTRVPLRDRQDAIIGFVGVNRDITELKHTQEVLQQFNQALEQRVKERTAELTAANEQLRQEIAERERVEQALRESEQEYRLLFENLQDLFFRIDTEGTVLLVSSSIILILGYLPENVIGTQVTETLSAAPEQWPQLLTALTHSGYVEGFELFLKHASGTAIIGSATAQMYTDLAGRHIIEGTIRDITKIKQAEAELKQHRDHLKELVKARTAELTDANTQLRREIMERQQVEATLANERNLLRTLIDTLPDFIYVKDMHSYWLLANEAVFRSLNVRSDADLSGKTDFDFFPRELAQQFYAGERAVFESGQPLINREEQTRDRVTGDPRWLLTTKAPFRNSQGAIAGLVGISRDITELKHIQHELRTHHDHLEELVQERTLELEQTNKALVHSLETLQITQDQLIQAEKMAALGGLVAGVAHEINTPVGIGVTAASHLEEKTRTIKTLYQEGRMTRSDVEKYFNTAFESTGMILQNLQRAAELIQSFKQVAVDQSSSEKRRFKLKAYIDDLLISLHPELKHTQHTVTVQCPEDLEILSYPGAFSQIVTNFIMNSLRHGFEHIAQGEMVLEINREGERLQLCYRDNGKGMAPEEQSHVFEPFYTTKRGQGDTGLGLYIVYNLVTQKLKGRITCKSAPGGGTTFVIELSEHQM